MDEKEKGVGRSYRSWSCGWVRLLGPGDGCPGVRSLVRYQCLRLGGSSLFFGREGEGEAGSVAGGESQEGASAGEGVAGPVLLFSLDEKEREAGSAGRSYWSCS